MEWRDAKRGRTEIIERSTKIPVSELRVGMFVSKLDRDWLETPFLIQGLLVRSLEDIRFVADYADYVWVDRAQYIWTEPEAHARLDPTPSPQTSYTNKLSAQEEHSHALRVHREARRVTRAFLEDLRLGGTINSSETKATVKACVGSIIRNPDALLWMTKIRSQDEYTAEHCLNVCILAIAFGRHLGMAEGELETLGLCGLLHDVGKMRVPLELLNKPRALTPKEFNQIKAHTVHGRNLLMATPGIYESVVDVAYSHHERIDGTGYPRKLPASEISRFARIIALVDAYDAMTADRCYSGAIPTTAALKIIYHCRGTHFDDALGLAFIKCIGVYPPGSIVELHNDLIGIVLETSERYRHLPRVILVHLGERALARQRVVNLADIEQGKLAREYLIKRVIKDGTYGISVRAYEEKGLVFNSL